MMQTILWKPTEEQINHSQMMQFIHFVHDRFNLTIEDYPQLYDWSIEKAEDFWGSFWEYSQIINHFNLL